MPSLATTEAIYNKIAEASAKKKHILSEIEELTTGDCVDENDFVCNTSALLQTKEKTAQLATTVAEAAKVADQSGRRIKELDCIKSRVQATLELLHSLTTQRDSLDGIGEAMEKADYETAVGYVTTYFETQKKLGGMTDIAVLGAAGPDQLQQQWTKLKEAITSEFGKACDANDVDKVKRFSKLFAPLDMSDQGIVSYLGWLKEQLNQALTVVAEQADGKPMRDIGLQLIHKMLDETVAELEGHEDHIHSCFGQNEVIQLFDTVHSCFSQYSSKVLNAFVTETDKVISAGYAAASNSTGGSGGGSSSSSSSSGSSGWSGGTSAISEGLTNTMSMSMSSVQSVSQSVAAASGLSTTAAVRDTQPQRLPQLDAKLVDKMLDQMSRISMYCCQYTNYLYEHVEALNDNDNDKEMSLSSSSSKKRRLPDFVTSSEVAIELHALGGQYVKLQETYLDIAFVKAASYSSGDDYGSSSSSCLDNAFIDDVFYVLRIALHRVLQTMNPTVICAVLNNIIEGSLKEKLLRKIHSNINLPKPKKVKAGEVCSNSTLLWLNSLERSCDYIKRLHKEFETLVYKNENMFGVHETTTIIQVVSGMQSVETDFREKLESKLRELAVAMEMQFKEKLRPFEETDYAINEQRYLGNEINDPWAINVMATLKPALAPYQEKLNDNNLEDLVQSLMEFVTEYLETTIKKKKFSNFGGMQLEKDVRIVKQFFQDLSTKPVRDKFTKLSHIVSLLVVEKVSEVYDMWSAATGTGSVGRAGGGISWRLTAKEVKEVLSLRVEFDQTMVTGLKLK